MARQAGRGPCALSTDIEVYGRNYGPGLLTERQAQALDKKIQAACTRVTESLDAAKNNFDTLVKLLEEAAGGQIHVAFGLKSWTAYVKEHVRITAPDPGERIVLVAYMSEKGLSQRAIADVLDVSKKTVQDDQSKVDTDYPPDVTGLDGKRQPRKKHPKPVEPEPEPPIDVEEVPVSPQPLVDENIVVNDDPESQKIQPDPPPKPKLPPITEEFRDNVDTLVADVESFRAIIEEIMADERYAGIACKRIARKNAEPLHRCVSVLKTIVQAVEARAK